MIIDNIRFDRASLSVTDVRYCKNVFSVVFIAKKCQTSPDNLMFFAARRTTKFSRDHRQNKLINHLQQNIQIYEYFVCK